MYISAKTTIEIQTSVLLTEGDEAFLVSSSPCTIQGWRPLSVSSQPAVLIEEHQDHRPGGDDQPHPGARAAPQQQPCPPQRDQTTIVPPYAITRIPQYWMKTLGT